jgi:amidase
MLGAVIETNPAALDIAARRDAERQAGKSRGPLHGIPVLLKDNIATNDAMETTAGSLALVGSRVPRDARIVARLRAAGAVILGKANLSEWANFRGVVPPAVNDRGLYLNGWSARGGFTRNPYDLARDPCGSSSGSGVAVAANVCPMAIGTETDGSIVCPAGHNAVVGLKPTIGLVAQDGIIPISHSQDTAGPMTRTVIDAAIALDVLRSPFRPVAGQRLPRSYRGAIRPGALRGARIGVDRRLFAGGPSADAGLNAVAERAFGVMADLGAVLVDPIEPPDTASIRDDEMTVLLTEFKVDMAAYLGGLRRTSMRSLDDLIAFNDEHCGAELRWFGQELFEVAAATDGLHDPGYQAARRRCLEVARGGIDRALQAGRLDAIVAPAYDDSSAPAVAGYPNLSIPTGTTDDGRPGGVWLSGGFLSEATLLAFAADLEAAVGPRPRPTFGGSVPELPPDAGICATPVERRKRATRSDLPADT